jgi:hypothetical protein
VDSPLVKDCPEIARHYRLKVVNGIQFTIVKHAQFRSRHTLDEEVGGSHQSTVINVVNNESLVKRVLNVISEHQPPTLHVAFVNLLPRVNLDNPASV